MGRSSVEARAGLAKSVPVLPEKLVNCALLPVPPCVPITWLASVNVIPKRKSPAFGGVLLKATAVAVPAAAVFRDGDRDAVWVVENGVAHRRFVVLGAQGESQVQISSGLAVGERVVVKGSDKVTEGQQVEGG